MSDTFPIDPDNSASEQLPIASDLFHILVCPVSKAPLKWVAGKLLSTDPQSRRAYRIDDGIPIMLVDESEQLEEGQWRELMAQPGPIGQGLAAIGGVEEG